MVTANLALEDQVQAQSVNLDDLDLQPIRLHKEHSPACHHHSLTNKDSVPILAIQANWVRLRSMEVVLEVLGDILLVLRVTRLDNMALMEPDLVIHMDRMEDAVVVGAETTDTN